MTKVSSDHFGTKIVPVCLFLRALYFPPPWFEVEQDLVWSQGLKAVSKQQNTVSHPSNLINSLFENQT